jgi:hypothetical protein
MEKKIISYSFKHLQDSKFQLEILTNDGVTLFQGDITDCQKHINYFIYDNPNAKFGTEPNEVLNLNDMKQTALDWHIEKRNRLEYEYSTKSIGISEYIERKKDIEVQAKQMEKEQIENAYWDGGQDVPMISKQCEQYYNETYGETKN